MARIEIKVELVAAEPIETGLWCPRCNLPSGSKISMVLLIGRSLSASTFTRCFDCSEPI